MKNSINYITQSNIDKADVIKIKYLCEIFQGVGQVLFHNIIVCMYVLTK